MRDPRILQAARKLSEAKLALAANHEKDVVVGRLVPTPGFPRSIAALWDWEFGGVSTIYDGDKERLLMCGIVGVLAFANSAFRVSEPYTGRLAWGIGGWRSLTCRKMPRSRWPTKMAHYG